MPVAPVPSATGEHDCVPNVGPHPDGSLRSAQNPVRCVTPRSPRSCSGHGRHRSAPRVAPEDSPADSFRDAYASWYEGVLGWPVAAGPPARLLTGTRFDVLELPADAGAELLRRPLATGPVALTGRRMRFLVAPGSADELEGLLDWLEWGGVALDLVGLGAGGRIAAPVPPGHPGGTPRGAAVWLRPPSRGVRHCCRPCPVPGRVPVPGTVVPGPISYAWSPRRRRNATGRACGGVRPWNERPRVSPWRSRRPRGSPAGRARGR